MRGEGVFYCITFVLCEIFYHYVPSCNEINASFKLCFVSNIWVLRPLLSYFPPKYNVSRTEPWGIRTENWYIFFVVVTKEKDVLGQGSEMLTREYKTWGFRRMNIWMQQRRFWVPDKLSTGGWEEHRSRIPENTKWEIWRQNKLKGNLICYPWLENQ